MANLKWTRKVANDSLEFHWFWWMHFASCVQLSRWNNKKKSDFDRKLIDTNNCAPFDGRELVCWAWSFVGKICETIENHFSKWWPNRTGFYWWMKETKRQRGRKREKTMPLQEQSCSTKIVQIKHEHWCGLQTEKSQCDGPVFFSFHSSILFSRNKEQKKYLNRFDAVATFAFTYSLVFIGKMAFVSCVAAAAAAGIGIQMKCKKKV